MPAEQKATKGQSLPQSGIGACCSGQQSILPAIAVIAWPDMDEPAIAAPDGASNSPAKASSNNILPMRSNDFIATNLS